MIMSNALLVDVSPEMVTLLGPGAVPASAIPPRSAALQISLDRPNRVSVKARFEPEGAEPLGERTILLAVQLSALERLFGWTAGEQDGRSFYLDEALGRIAASLFEERASPGASQTYRLAKSIELICDLAAALECDRLIPLPDEGGLSRQDLERLSQARRMIDEHWGRKITLCQIARDCGLNRSKLTRAFREVYRCSISEALAERRLAEARRQLLATDLPVGVIGYRSGYLNNASFTRAFGRRFGVSPSDYRTAGAVA